MRIAYAFYWNGSRDGVTAKIATQVALWREAGHDVGAFQLKRGSSSGAAAPGERLFGFTSALRRVSATRRLAAALGDYRPDLLYLRYDLFVPPLRSLLSRFTSAVELNEGRAEYRLRGRAVAAYDGLNRRLTLAGANGLVAVTNEIIREHPLEGPWVVIGNGIDLRRYEPLPPTPGGRARAVFLGSAWLVWHGVDKIIELARLLPEVDFDLIGPAPVDLPSAPPNVHVHGHLSPGAYGPLLARADVAIGTLAFHRAGLHEGSPLKTREYLAYGLPVVIGYRDTDFLDEHPWFLCELPNEDAGVDRDADRVRAFIEAVKGRRVPQAAVADRIGAVGKERRRLEFFARLVSGTDLPVRSGATPTEHTPDSGWISPEVGGAGNDEGSNRNPRDARQNSERDEAEDAVGGD